MLQLSFGYKQWHVKVDGPLEIKWTVQAAENGRSVKLKPNSGRSSRTYATNDSALFLDRSLSESITHYGNPDIFRSDG